MDVIAIAIGSAVVGVVAFAGAAVMLARRVTAGDARVLRSGGARRQHLITALRAAGFAVDDIGSELECVIGGVSVLLSVDASGRARDAYQARTYLKGGDVDDTVGDAHVVVETLSAKNVRSPRIVEALRAVAPGTPLRCVGSMVQAVAADAGAIVAAAKLVAAVAAFPDEELRRIGIPIGAVDAGGGRWQIAIDDVVLTLRFYESVWLECSVQRGVVPDGSFTIAERATEMVRSGIPQAGRLQELAEVVGDVRIDVVGGTLTSRHPAAVDPDVVRAVAEAMAVVADTPLPSSAFR